VPGVHGDITRRSYVVVDVFTETPLEGNPLAVVTDGDGLSEKLMQRIAREFNQSETTYLLSPSSSRAHAALRSFTASGDESSAPATISLGAWWWLIASGRFELDDGHTELTQELGGSRLPVLVVRERGRLTAVGLRQTAPQFGAEIEDGDELAGALGLSARDLSPECAQVVFTVFGACVELARGVLTLDRRHASRSRRNQGVVES
jgi:trans-2,3-dihydro-3-hydroxyanthranilate isomerase